MGVTARVRSSGVTGRPHRAAGWVAAVALGVLAGCGTEESVRAQGGTASIPASPTLDEQGHPVGLHEWNPFTDRLTSGGQPEGEVAFANLAAMGYRTIVSVDGARPDLETAKKYGLRYVHVPTQYSGTKPEEIARIAKAIETSDGPVYLHCHHGKHRSPGALGAACVALGILEPEQALAELAASGTDPKYKGLFRDVQQAKRLSKADLDAIPADLPEFVSPGDLATWMVDVDLRSDHLKASRAAKWGVPADNPDVDPPHEARMLWEHYREIARLDEAKEHGEPFLKFLSDGEAAATDLEAALRAKDAQASDAAHERVKKSCAACHAKYRDN